MLLLPVAFCTPIHKHGCDLNIEGGEGANVILCYNICDRDCRFKNTPFSSYRSSYDEVSMASFCHRVVIRTSEVSLLGEGVKPLSDWFRGKSM